MNSSKRNVDTGGSNQIPKEITDNFRSEVSTHHTPMTADDEYQVDGSHDWSNAYFQTANSFRINETFRDLPTDEPTDDELVDALREHGKSGDDVYKTIKTIRTMDRNMHPTTEDMQVLRFAGESYWDSVMQKLGITEKNSLSYVRGLLDFGSPEQIQAFKDKIVGATIYEKGFMSTTYNLDPNKAVFNHKPVRIEMLAKQNTRGLFSPTEYEDEFVLARNSGYNIKDVAYDSKTHQIVFIVETV